MVFPSLFVVPSGKACYNRRQAPEGWRRSVSLGRCSGSPFFIWFSIVVYVRLADGGLSVSGTGKTDQQTDPGFFSDFQPDSEFKDQTVHLHPYQPQSFPYFIRYDRSRCCTQKDEWICILCPDSWFPSGIRPIIGSNQKGIRTAFDHQDSRCL